MAGNTANCVSEWQTITSDPEILDYVQHCHIEFIDDPSKYSIYGHRNFDSQQQSLITTEVCKLLQFGVIASSVHEVGECISPIFVIPKPDGSHRLIFNFKHCNQAVLYRHFKTDTLNAVISLITAGAYMASIDPQHAYYSIPISSEHRKFLNFSWQGHLYEFKVLPMGLSSSPRIFTKVVGNTKKDKPTLSQNHLNSLYW